MKFRYTFRLGDTTYSADYLSNKWQEEIKPPNGMRYGFWIENLQKEAID